MNKRSLLLALLALGVVAVSAVGLSANRASANVERWCPPGVLYCGEGDQSPDPSGGAMENGGYNGGNGNGGSVNGGVEG